ncbi:hypothetical protein LB533_29460 [Mesorhizobium sp. BR1-1-13]|uniref:hypothetical protein n=1 Tax=unclassified Mesorhizobium TaxID=325217 RepID=UPI001CD0E8E7|nr:MULTISPECIES: hypothetical protein [unclassified Mesorhizobium]MBZ9945220.1 hypothetical protein [Mesorhizobium sp. BR1-1-13]
MPTLNTDPFVSVNVAPVHARLSVLKAMVKVMRVPGSVKVVGLALTELIVTALAAVLAKTESIAREINTPMYRANSLAGSLARLSSAKRLRVVLWTPEAPRDTYWRGQSKKPNMDRPSPGVTVWRRANNL